MELPIEQAVVPIVPPDTHVPAMKKLPLGALIGTSIYALGINAVWLSFNNIILPSQVENATAKINAPLYLGLIEGVGIAVAVIINIVAGIISDHYASPRFGRRAPIMLLGSVLTVPFLLLGVFLPVTLPLAFAAYVGMQSMTNISVAAFHPTLADFVPQKQRGISAGLKGLFTIIGAAVGFVVVDNLLSSKQEPAALVVLAVLFVATTTANILAMRPYDKVPVPPPTPIRLGAALREVLRFKPIGGGFYWFIFGSFLIYMGLSSFQAYSLYYIEAVLHQSQSQAQRSQGISGAIILVVSIVFAVFAGYLSDRIGRRNLIITAALGSAVLSLLFPFVPQIGLLFPAIAGFGVFLVVAALYSAAIAMVQSVDTALSSDLVPMDEAGKYMSYANLAVGVANAAAPPLFGIVLYIQGVPTLHSFTAFFIITAFFLIVSAIIFSTRVVNR